VAEGEVFNEEYRHTSLIATLREQWNLGDPFTGRDAASRTFSRVFTLDAPRDPEPWPSPDGLRAYAAQNKIKIEGIPEDPNVGIPPENAIEVLQNSMEMFFPRLAPAAASPAAPGTT
jgi:hypothetical protein